MEESYTELDKFIFDKAIALVAKKGFVCTDPDCFQLRRLSEDRDSRGDPIFELYQVTEIRDAYYICHAEILPEDYEEDLPEILETYGYTARCCMDLVQELGGNCHKQKDVTEAYAIAAECCFEICLPTEDTNQPEKTFTAAVIAITNSILQQE